MDNPVQAAGAARGRDRRPTRPNCEAVQPATGLRDNAVLHSTPCCASQGVINIGCLPASDRKRETFRAYFARQGIHSNRIKAENINEISIGDS
jgi:hypothetical protein